MDPGGGCDGKSIALRVAGWALRLPPRGAQRSGRAGLRADAAEALAQYAATGCLNATFYAGAETQLERVLKLASGLPPEFMAKTAVYGRERGHMKDMPALLVAVLSARDAALMERVFDRVIDTPRMLRTFVQIVRSGVTRPQVARHGAPRARSAAGSIAGPTKRSSRRRSATSRRWRTSCGWCTRSRRRRSREALYGYLIGREVDRAALPALVRAVRGVQGGRPRRQCPTCRSRC